MARKTRKYESCVCDICKKTMPFDLQKIERCFTIGKTKLDAVLYCYMDGGRRNADICEKCEEKVVKAFAT